MLLQQCLYLLLILSVQSADGTADNTPFSTGTQYNYSYSAEISLKGVDNFYFTANAELSAYELVLCEEIEGVSVREDLIGVTNCTAVQIVLTDTTLISVQAKKQGQEIFEHQLNFSNWFSFYQRQDGVIGKVRYPEKENTQVLQLKKAVASSFSLKLHSYVKNKGTASRQYGGWAYRVPDVDHTGTHSARYEVKDGNRMVTYKKMRRDLENDHVHNKEIHILKETGHIQLVRVEDIAEISHSTADSRSVEEPPPIKANGLSQINLLKKSTFEPSSIVEPSGLILDSIIAQRPVRDPIKYKTALSQVQSNMSLTEHCYPNTNIECVKTIRRIISIIELMREQDIVQLASEYLSCPFIHKRSNILTTIDAFGMCKRASCEFVLVKFLNTSCIEKEMAFSLLPHLFATKRPSLFAVDTMDLLAFDPELLPKQLHNHTLSDMAVLALGSMSASLRDSDPLLSDRIISKLHRMTLPHNHDRYKRDNSPKLNSDSIAMMRQSNLINSLGNAGHERSFNILRSFIESKHAPTLLRRSAVHSMRGYNTDEAAETILSAALIDEAEVVRYEATVQYQLHPRADEMSQVLYEFYNFTNSVQSPADASKRRIRRFNIFAALSFHIQTPSFNWKKEVGTDNFGASMGLIVENIIDLNIKPLSGNFLIDIHDEAYFVANLGYVGVHFDVFRARVCLKGHISYNLNILQELGINSFSDLTHIYDKTIGAVVKAIKQAITDFRAVLGVHIDLKYIFHTLVEAVSELPFIIENLVVSPTLRRILEQLKELPFIQKGIMLIDEVKSLYNDVRSDVLMFYQEISDCVTITLPWVGETIKTAILTIGKSIEHFFKNPLISIRDVIVSIFQLRSAFDAVIDCKDVLLNATKFQGAHIRGWMDLVNRLKEIYNTTIETKDLIIKEAKEFSEIRNISSFEHATGLNLTILRLKAYGDLKKALEKFIEPLAPLLKIVEPFIKAYTSAVNVIKTAIRAYEILRETYEKVKDLIERLFGPKFNRNFPKQLRGEDGCKETKCECGFYPTTSGDPKIFKKGIQLEIGEGDALVAPTSGLYLRLPDNQVLIYPSGSFSKYVIMIHNVDLLDNITHSGVNVQGGDEIGTVTGNEFGCEPNFIHFTMMSKSSGYTTNPFPFLQPRFLEIPKWVQECNDYLLVVKGKVHKSGAIIGKPDTKKDKERECGEEEYCKNPDLPDNNDPPPNKSEYKPKYTDAISGDPGVKDALLPKASSNGPRGPLNRPIGTNLGRYFTKEQGEKYSKEPVSKGGFHIVVTGGGSEFNFSVNTIKIRLILDILKQLTSNEVRQVIDTVENTIEYLRKALDCSNEKLIDPSLLDLESIQNALKIRGLPYQGEREQLVDQLIALPKDLCPNLQHAIPKNRWCVLSEDCLSLRCAAALKLDFFKYSVTFSITLDPCAPSITLKFQDFEKVIELPDIYGGSVINIAHESAELLGIATVNLDVKLTRKDLNIYLDFKAYLCPPGESSDDTSQCFFSLELLAGAGFQIPSPFNCTKKTSKREVTTSGDVTPCGIKIPDFLNMTLGEFVTYIKDFGDTGSASNSTNKLNQLMQDLRNVFLNELLKAIISGKSPISGDDTDFPTKFDVCIVGSYEQQFHYNFFSIDKYIIIGWVPLHFTLSLDGLYGFSIGAKLCFISMVASADATPNVGLVLSGSAAISIFIAEAGVSLTGVILNTHLPIQPSVGFKKFPLALRIRIDVNIIPLGVSLHIYLKITIHLFFIHFTKTIINIEIFHWNSPAIEVNLLDISNEKKDDSPPLFSPITEQSRRRRSLPDSEYHFVTRRDVATPCTVTQVAGRDYTNPAFILQISVADDKSQVELTYSVGTYKGGYDLVNNERMNGNTVLIARNLTSNIPLYWTATGSNSQGVSASTQCSLNTYDMTPPDGRVDFNTYIYSSHPSKLIGEATIIDDTNLKMQFQAIGYGTGRFGDQTVPFTSFDFDQLNFKTDTSSLQQFITISNKRLGITPFKVSVVTDLQACASDCLTFPTKCFSFNYADVHRVCELLNDIGADANIEFAKNLQYSYYEKRGVGNRVSFKYQDLPLVHDRLYFLNLYIVNQLLYENYVNSPGMLIDFTPPEPGIVRNASLNETRHDGCSAAFNQRCGPAEYVTPLKYHRIIQDGPGSECVYNGPSVEKDIKYSRLNSFVSVTFQGIHDFQSGMYAYAWYMGYEPCKGGALSPRDPNADSTTQLSDINQGRVIQHFDDGIYYITVQGLNQVIFGSSGVLTLCHSTPYIIDTTPPIIYNVTRIAYNEDTNISTFFYEAWDNLSGLKSVELGVGLTISDISILQWTKIFTNRTATLTHHIDVPDGTRAFIRIKATNHVDLTSTSFAPRPIIVDRSPPSPGIVLDGDGPGDSNWKYQSSGSVLCAKWRNFYDPQSGISAYRWGAGTAPGLSDTVPFTDNLPPSTHSQCRGGLQLKHDTIYYSTVIAFNSDTDHPRNISVSSNGVLVDLTNPVGGFVKDGLSVHMNLNYTSNPKSVQAVWGNFSDPESGIAQYNATIHSAEVSKYLPTNSPPELDQKCPVPSNSTDIPVKPPFIPSDSVKFEITQNSVSVGLKTTINWEHFEFSHGDYVRTTITGQDGATRTTDVTSQGFLVDLTPPKVIQLYDGPSPQIDETYQVSINTLSASWIMVDPESGISGYRLSVFARHQGSISQFYPQNAPYITIQPQEIGESGVLTCWSINTDLSIGTLYAVRIAPINRANLSTVYTSSGIIPDNTPPDISYVRIDTYGDESEEKTPENAVEIGDTGGIPIQWLAIDQESGIAGFVAAVGTYSGGTDISNFKEYSADINVIIPVKLQLYENTQKFYFLTVKAKNGAGLLSAAYEPTKIKVLRANVAGVVTVGHSGVRSNGQFQPERDTVTLKFEGFSSELCGIQYYEWSMGTSFAEDQIQEFTTAGVVVGADGSGVAQALLPLELGENVYTEVRAITACSADDQQATINSFGKEITVDWTAPYIQLTELGQRKNGTAFRNPHADSKIYQYNPSTLVASWNAADPQSGIADFRFEVGTHPYSDGVTPPKTTQKSRLLTNDVDPEHNGKPNILQITAFNRAGVPTFLIAPGITIDTNIPSIQQVQFNCTKYATTNTSSLTCHWHGAFDQYSEIIGYEIMLGEAEVDSSYFYEYLNSDTLMVTMSNFSANLQSGEQVYTLNIINSVGLINHEFASLVIDDTAPFPRAVSVLLDQTRVGFVPTGKVNSSFSYKNTSSSTQCITIVMNIRVKWEAFLDYETPMDYYEIGLGEKIGQINVMNFYNVGLINEYFLEGIDLTRHPVIYVIIRGFNKVGLYQVANSNPIYISLHNPQLAYVFDGSKSHDLQAQTGTSYLEAFWNFYDPCLGVSYDWAIFYSNQTLVQNLTRVQTSESSNDNLAIAEDTRVYVLVNLNSSLGYVRSARSDGITVQVEPLIPGVVYDGPFPGVDFNHQASLTTLMANWNSFGGINNPRRLSETVINYELGVGTAPRGDSRFNIRELHDVYLNTSITLLNLNLQINNTYYVTVRATSATFQKAEVTSNGIRPIRFNNIVQPGIVSIPKFQSVTKFLDINWKGFTSLLPIVSFEYAISTNPGLANFSCESFENAASPLANYFSVTPYTKSKSDLTAVVSGLQLIGATQYYAYVRAIDDSFQCAAAVSNPIEIDTTPPILGNFNIGFNVTSLRPDITVPQIEYVTTNNSLSVAWVGFYDPESSIANYQIKLVTENGCNQLVNCDGLTAFTTINNVTKHTFYVLNILGDKFYFIALRAINRAGLTSCKVSQPVKLDRITPNSAVVKHGNNWKLSSPFQGSTSTLSGILALVTDRHEAVCMDRMYNESSSREGWRTVNQSVTPTVPVGPNNPTGKTLAYSPKQARFNTEHAFLEISMTRDIQHNRMLSAAAVTEFSVVSFNEISIRIKAAPNFQAVTSVLIWDGPVSMVQDYEILDVPSNTTQSNLNSTTIHSSCVYIPPPNPSPKPYKAFGLQLHPSSNSTHARALLWYRGEELGEMAHEWITLDFNPTTDYHTYHFKIEKKSTLTPSTVVKYIWSLGLKVDDQFLGSLVGLPQFGSSLYFVLHVRNYNGRVEPFSNPFSPPTTSAFYTDVILPVNSSRVCKYGNPFYSEIAPFVKFEVAAGRSFGSTEVSLAAGREYQPIDKLPCIPCKAYCRSEPDTCNSSCNSPVYYISFEAKALQLLAGCTHPFNKTNATCTPYNYTTSEIPEDQLYLHNLTFVPYVYYMKVRGYTASGHIAYGYSQGVQLDPTPPNCTLIEHIQRDLRRNELVNTTVQYSTDSLAVRYQCVDTRSDVSGYEIAYTDNIDDVSSLLYNSVGTDTTVNITNLSLNPLHKYYVVVRATNGAGLTTVLKSKGVRILNKEPDVSRAVMHSMFSTTLNTRVQNTSISTQRALLGLSWTGFYQTRYEDNYTVKNQTLFWTVGTEANKQDIIPLFEINFNSSFSIRINETDMIGNTSFFVSNITDLAKLANKTNYKYVKGDRILQVEPGRIFFQTLILCAIQPKCKPAGTHSVTFHRQSDQYSVSLANQAFSLSIDKGSREYSSQSNGGFIPPQLYPTNCRVYFSQDIKAGSGFVIGDLSLDDMKVEYDVITAPSSSPYIPFIVDPNNTLQRVDRFLLFRIQYFLGPAFFISPIGGEDFPSWLKVEINFNPSRIDEGMQPVLTAWDPNQQIWIAARSSCNFTKEDTISDNTLTTYFCPCAHTNERCNKPWQFILALATSEFVDTAPVPDTVPCISVTEGSGTLQHPLLYSDAQNDSVEYNLTSVVFTHNLVAGIANSMFYFTPCKGCFGNVTVNYQITETGTPALLGRALSAANGFRIEILAVNANPVLVLSNGDKTSISLYRDYNTSVASFESSFYSYDGDSGDQIHFNYLNCSHCSLVLRNMTTSERSHIPAKYRASSPGLSLQYTAYADYYGEDRFGIVAQDRSGAYSLARIYSIYIRFRPCLHNSTCKGPTNDPECNGISTESDFTDEYTCECTEEWALRRCSTPNTCISQPCRYNASCQVKEDGKFECICEPDWPCSHDSSQSLTPAEVSAVVIAVIIAILVVSGILLGICICILKHKKNKIYIIIDGNARKRLALEGEEFEVEEIDILQVAPLGSDYAIPLLTESVL